MEDVFALLAHAPIRPDPGMPGAWWARGAIAGRPVRIVCKIVNEPVGEILVITAMWEDADE